MLVIPVILEELSDLPPALQERQWVVLTDATPEKIDQAASLVAGQLQSATQPTSGLLKPRLEAVTNWVLRKARGFSSGAAEQNLEEPMPPPGVDAGGPPQPSDRPNSVFVVHGHDTRFSDEVVQCLTSVNVAAVLLSRIGGAQQSLFQKFLNSAGEARFAVVLLSGDDFGASRVQYEAPGVGERCLQYRARQNVIFELGFFYGRLGWENVFVVYKPPPMVFPNFEYPSDLPGTLFHQVDDTGAWRQSLAQRLANAGFSFGTSVSA
jgi:hypothetical protein